MKSPTKSARTMWCGPYALALLSGLSYDEAYRKALRSINVRRGKEAVERGLRRDYWQRAALKGVSHYEMRVAAKALGIKIEWKLDARRRQYEHHGVTLLTFVREHTVKGKTYLVSAANHYVVVRDGIVYDNTLTKPAHPVEEYPRAKLGRLECYAEVRPRPAAMTEAA